MADALPPSVTGIPPEGFSPAPTPSGNPGDVAQGLGLVREAISILQQAAMRLPVGSDPHQKVTSVISSLSRVAPAQEAEPGVQKTVQRNLASQAQAQSSHVDVLRALAGQGAAGMMGPMDQGQQ